MSIISVFATGRYEIAIVLPAKDEDAINIVSLSILITILLTIITTIIILLFKENILKMLNADELLNLLYLLPLSLLLSGLYQTFNYWSNRKKYFKNMAKSRISQAFGAGIGQLGLGYNSLYGGMIYGSILGRVLSVYLLIKVFLINDRLLIKAVDKAVMFKQIKKYKDFPLYNSLHAFSDVAKTSLLTIIISSFFGSAVLGFYALALRVLQAPLGIIGSSFGQILYQRLNTVKENNESIYEVSKSILLKLIIISLPVFTLLYIFAPEIFGFIFGQEWRVAGEYTKILLPYLFINFLDPRVSQIPIILGKQKIFFLINLFANISIILLVYSINEVENDIHSFLHVLSTFFTIFYFGLLLWILKIAKKIN